MGSSSTPSALKGLENDPKRKSLKLEVKQSPVYGVFVCFSFPFLFRASSLPLILRVLLFRTLFFLCLSLSLSSRLDLVRSSKMQLSEFHHQRMRY